MQVSDTDGETEMSWYAIFRLKYTCSLLLDKISRDPGELPQQRSLEEEEKVFVVAKTEEKEGKEDI
ncbi:hypothetical protein PMAC_002064 [Pneumocystis sp. 'macacae']|nr:hypothetical protein PMAC_002064 [Pneumocystis sp. 'macacae']